MRTRRWHSYAVTVAVLILQVSVSALGTIGMCLDRPHTHGGVPAPDCLMHESQPAGTTPEASTHGHHHQHDNGTSTDTARVTCSCASDPLTLLTTDVAVVSNISIALLDCVAPLSLERTQSAPDVRLAPLSPPPRPSLS
jgi:hypothetical protein